MNGIRIVAIGRLANFQLLGIFFRYKKINMNIVLSRKPECGGKLPQYHHRGKLEYTILADYTLYIINNFTFRSM